MTNTEYSTTPTTPQPERQGNYFIFPGLRELLVGMSIIVGIEFLTGTSNLASLPLQHMFFAAVLICGCLLIISFCLAMVLSEHPWQRNSTDTLFVALLVMPPAFCAGFFLIGLLFPSLAVHYPAYTEPTAILLLNWIWHLLKCSWAILTQIANIYGWFTIIASGVLLLHIYFKHGNAINDKLNSL